MKKLYSFGLTVKAGWQIFCLAKHGACDGITPIHVRSEVVDGINLLQGYLIPFPVPSQYRY
jgi:hypothetical protein